MVDHLGSGFVKSLSFNPPTDKEIEKVLYNIINKEGASNIAINKYQIEDIKQKANRDIRSAIQLLQFYTAGWLGNQKLQTQEISPSKRRKVEDNSDGEFCIEEKQTPKNELSPYKMQKSIDNSRDNNLSIFHVLGKFLYNKRLDNKTKEAR